MLEGHNSNPKPLKEDISDCKSSDDDDSEDEYEDFLADEVLDLDILDLDADRRSILRDVKVVTAIDEEDREEQEESQVMTIIDVEDREESHESNIINHDLSLNVMTVEQNDELISQCALLKTWKGEKLKVRDGLKAIKLLVSKQQGEALRRPTKATLARRRKIREMFPEIVRESPQQ